MIAVVPLFPDQASSTAAGVDHFFYFMLAVTGLVALLVTVLILFFGVKYRRRGGAAADPHIKGSLKLELIWSMIPLAIFMLMYVWGARLYSTVAEPPDNAEEVYVVGKQWMWKVQHESGQREINELHCSVGRPVKLTLISEDVIHDFGLPEFRTKIDVLPARYVRTWFEPTRTGRFHIFCDQYCGTSHSNMVGWVTVMEQEEYADWLNSKAEGSMALQGRKQFLTHECISCHRTDKQARAPTLEGLYRSEVRLRDGKTIVADDAYIRESIINPRAKVVEGWEPIMPTFKGQLAERREGRSKEELEIDEEEVLLQLIAYIKSLGRGQTPLRTEDFPPPSGAPTVPPGDK